MATLKISDLSVGDWVGIDQAELNMPSDDLATAYIEKLRKPIRIKGISEDSDTVIADIEIVDGWGSIMMKCEHLRPIPITVEILEKNGWRVIAKEVLGEDYEYHGEERVWEDENYSIDICEAKQGVFWYSWSNEYYMWRLEYVHQLQHLIRLAGLDREINL
jgi:hypothetical protein